MDGEWILGRPKKGSKRTFQQNPREHSDDARFGINCAPPIFCGRGARTFRPYPYPYGYPNPNPHSNHNLVLVFFLGEEHELCSNLDRGLLAYDALGAILGTYCFLRPGPLGSDCHLPVAVQLSPDFVMASSPLVTGLLTLKCAQTATVRCELLKKNCQVAVKFLDFL